MKPARKTYWHLGAGRRLPSDYEIATSRLLYHVERGGFAVQMPSSAFYARHQRDARLVSDRWDQFVDPRATTYTKYVDAQGESEAYVTRLLSSIEQSDYDLGLSPEWVTILARALSPLRFLCHGMQMIAAYIGQMAPSGRIAVAALFQCGDEIRRIQRIAHRLALLAKLIPDVGPAGRTAWQSEARWQPFRRAIEKLLTTYDWGEALVALNVCFKPMIDDLFLVRLADLADRSGDHVDAQVFRSLFDDCRWHAAWTDGVLALACSDRSSNRTVVSAWTDSWTSMVDAAASAGKGIVG